MTSEADDEGDISVSNDALERTPVVELAQATDAMDLGDVKAIDTQSTHLASPVQPQDAVQDEDVADAIPVEDDSGDIGITATDEPPLTDVSQGAQGPDLPEAIALPQTPTMETAESPRGEGMVDFNEGAQDRSPVATPSTTTGPSRRSSSSVRGIRPSRSSSRSPPSSPVPDEPEFLSSKPRIPRSTSINVNGEEEDDSAPFESIQLESTPPPMSPIPLPRSPTLAPPDSIGKKRVSWNGLGMTKEGERFAHTTNSPRANGVSNGTDSRRSSAASPVKPSGSSTPTRQAPPAHPHPFPLPSATSPPPLNSAGPSRQPHPVGLGVKGGTSTEDVISRTRPNWLPPKDKVEDEVHLHQWEEMMTHSREHEKELRKVREAQKKAKDHKMAMATPRWEALLGSPDFSAAKVRNSPELRHMWFEGIPSHLRGRAWAAVIGNPLALSKDAYKFYSSRARKSLADGRFPQDVLDRMEADLDETLVTLRLFGRGSPVREDLKELLCAWVVYRSDEGRGYAPYINLLGATFLLNSPPSEAFLSLINFLSRPCLHAFYTETQDEIDAFYRVFENLQADTFPKIFANCKNLGLKLPESYFRSVLVEQVPFEACCRLWDQIVLDGDGFIFRAALAIFGFLEPRMYYPDREEILSVLEGRNKATLAITERERERAKLKGEAFQEGLDGKLSVFGLNEDAIFDWLANDGWKEARFERLVTREMPD